MKVAFVGVKRKYQELAPEYRAAFTQYHLELPYYYAKYGENDVTVTTVDYDHKDSLFGKWDDVHEPTLNLQQESGFVLSKEKFDVVVHWRKWFPELYRPEAINVINCQDHSFSPEWKESVRQAMNEGKLRGILCFPKWHKQNLHNETGIPLDRLYDGVTLGVDTDVYKPALVKDPFQMLWASDPGRGLVDAIQFAVRLWQQDKRFHLEVCYPDYVKGMSSISHPAIRFHRNLDNGPKLWELFNSSGILPYTSTFMEPSSRAHRQAQAAGSLVLYPPGRGTPSELIESGKTGVVAPIHTWEKTIRDLVETGEWKKYGEQARELAVSENWSVQAERFNLLMGKLRETKNA